MSLDTERFHLSEDRVLHVGDEAFKLNKREGIVVEMLLTGRVVTYDAIMAAFWPIEADIPLDVRNNIWATIFALRRKIPLFKFRNIEELGYILVN